MLKTRAIIQEYCSRNQMRCPYFKMQSSQSRWKFSKPAGDIRFNSFDSLWVAFAHVNQLGSSNSRLFKRVKQSNSVFHVCAKRIRRNTRLYNSMLHGITKNILNFKDRLIVAKSNGKNHDKMNNDLNFDVLFTITWLFVALMTLWLTDRLTDSASNWPTDRLISMLNKGGEFLKKLWRCVSGE